MPFIEMNQAEHPSGRQLPVGDGGVLNIVELMADGYPAGCVLLLKQGTVRCLNTSGGEVWKVTAPLSADGREFWFVDAQAIKEANELSLTYRETIQMPGGILTLHFDTLEKSLGKLLMDATRRQPEYRTFGLWPDWRRRTGALSGVSDGARVVFSASDPARQIELRFEGDRLSELRWRNTLVLTGSQPFMSMPKDLTRRFTRDPDGAFNHDGFVEHVGLSLN
ncbi:MAG: hypothetical protein H6741_25475 [Alphaproteobacteria bacterium]|nr:hypothetical protein [Alphaproteobacteria bacterium]MCB9796062.1 hypothetical protein [Alphaproteobacteria bacterium]